MKRLVLQLSVVAVVVALGGVAIWQARRIALAAPVETAPAPQVAAEPEPIPLVEEQRAGSAASPAASDAVAAAAENDGWNRAADAALAASPAGDDRWGGYDNGYDSGGYENNGYENNGYNGNRAHDDDAYRSPAAQPVPAESHFAGRENSLRSTVAARPAALDAMTLPADEFDPPPTLAQTTNSVSRDDEYADDGDDAYAPPRPLPAADNRSAIRAALAAEDEAAARHFQEEEHEYNDDARHAPVEHREAAADNNDDFRGARFGGGDFGGNHVPENTPTPADDSPRVADNPSAGGGRFDGASDRFGSIPATLPPRTPAPAASEENPTSANPAASSNDAPPSPLATRHSPLSEAQASGKPGARHLEGPQTPNLVIEKHAPPEIQVGKPAQFAIKVRNVGQVSAEQVLLRDEVPQGTKLIDTTPQAQLAANGALMWQLGSLAPGEELTAVMQVMPQEEGEIGSVATVTFQASASARAISTRPRLAIEHAAAAKVHIGQEIAFVIKVTNPGTGAATNVVLKEQVPEGLTHVAGKELEYAMGALRPGEERQLELRLRADKAGTIENVIFVEGDAGLKAEHRLSIEVVAPQLEVAVEGPSKRYLERQATHSIIVSNPGTASARDVELVAHLPKGLKFHSTNNAGQYEPRSHAVIWSLAELPAGSKGTVQLNTIPIEMGEQKIRVESRAQLGLAASQEQSLAVDGLVALLFEVVDTADPIEVGKQTSYEVRVVNQGSKVANNVRIVASAPADMKLVSGEGATRATVDGQQIIFEPLARLNPQADALFKIHAEGLRPGDQRIRVQVYCDEVETPITKEESTRVYADQ